MKYSARCKRQSFVESVRLTMILLAHPIGQPVFVSPDDIDGAVGRAAVHDDVLEIGVALKEDGADCLLDELALIVARRDDGDARPGRAVGPGGW